MSSTWSSRPTYSSVFYFVLLHLHCAGFCMGPVISSESVEHMKLVHSSES